MSRFRSLRSTPSICLLAALLFAPGGCASSGRTPASAEAPVSSEPEVSEPPLAPPPSESPAPDADSPQGLTEDEILARAPETSVRSESLDVASMSLAELNRMAPLENIRFDYDSAELSAEARAILTRNAEWLRRFPTVEVQIEGHCDDRGTVEYNLALGEARARSVKDFLTRLDISPGRLRTISFGKEAPLDPGQNEAAWRKNRRAHFVVVGR